MEGGGGICFLGTACTYGDTCSISMATPLLFQNNSLSVTEGFPLAGAGILVLDANISLPAASYINNDVRASFRPICNSSYLSFVRCHGLNLPYSLLLASLRRRMVGQLRPSKRQIVVSGSI